MRFGRLARKQCESGRWSYDLMTLEGFSCRGVLDTSQEQLADNGYAGHSFRSVNVDVETGYRRSGERMEQESANCLVCLGLR